MVVFLCTFVSTCILQKKIIFRYIDGWFIGVHDKRANFL